MSWDPTKESSFSFAQRTPGRETGRQHKPSLHQWWKHKPGITKLSNWYNPTFTPMQQPSILREKNQTSYWGESHLSALPNPAITLRRLPWARADWNVPSASAHVCLVGRGLHFLQQTVEMLFSPCVHHPKSSLAYYLGLFLTVPRHCLLPISLLDNNQSWNYSLPS